MGYKDILKKLFPGAFHRYVRRSYRRVYRDKKALAERDPSLLIQRIYNETGYFENEIDLENPRTFNEKLNWMKLFWYDERAPRCSDKYLVREYVKEKGLGHLLNELYAVYDRPRDIRLKDLPAEFVLKPTHDSGHVILCRDKKDFHLHDAKRKLARWLSVDYCYISGEWPYHSDKRRIIAERFLENREQGELIDYKFFCFGGKPEMIFLASDRANHVKADFYDLDWNKLPFRWKYEPSGKEFPRPKCLSEMVEYARILSEGFPFVRVDFYETNGRVYFGELTFFHGGARGYFKPAEMDRKLGDLICLPETKDDPWHKAVLKKK